MKAWLVLGYAYSIIRLFERGTWLVNVGM
jgi:hypothetical protein